MFKIYTIGMYLLDRLHELGVCHVFGVAGDYNLTFLDDVINHEEIDWIGTCNELNAAYAADGYARMKGIGAVVTTFGVGELSAVNGIAGAYAEKVPVVKITGAPHTDIMETDLAVHHTLGDGIFDHFSKIFQQITAAQAFLTVENAAEEIDRVLSYCWFEKCPVYINFPVNVVKQPIDKPKAKLLMQEKTNNITEIEWVLEKILTVVEGSKNPIILADYEVNRYQLEKELKELMTITGFPIATLSRGKGIVDERHPQFIGIYNGDLSQPYVRERIDNSDCIMSIGVQLTDLTTGGFSHRFSDRNTIEINQGQIKIKREMGININCELKDVLQRLISLFYSKVNSVPLQINSFLSQSIDMTVKCRGQKNKLISQRYFWNQIYHFLQSEDVILADQGTAFYGATMIPLPSKCRFIGQPLWGSIGYTLPALLGAQLADVNQRNILFIGDGAFQMVSQELSTIIRERLTPIIFLLNNDGYTTERIIQGEFQKYNDLQMWDYCQFAKCLTLDEENILIMKVCDEEEFEEALLQASHAVNHLIFIEVIMERSDVPVLLDGLAKKLQK
ncbi:indolepyruvate decarboxylase [Bacillus thuringiensis]|uniref:Alpha-keto-acid decarboxylase n=2 Tax=Bacillaceae TaxID=186817 RepID=A0ABD6SC20_BACTU|nr:MULTISPECIES: alpha-keto acid decarboxylase family protein [Bacillus]PDY96163.1 indolepyruvate decarboxylase [Bacillus thuringiensis]PEF25268.1 indolepyruvate decarboxylase [Bacillus thuringiensis]PES74640.1 indolepyruvate decarboxylase [Bacillus thuringiensis]PET82224.1 indolepyruvate decarboxylase [Bacillus thuringiensis]PEU89021.1 indolepyruvate decarboxylase [Bacillus sp. AFS012607]